MQPPPFCFGTICPEVSAHHIARRAYFRSPSFRINHSERAGSPKGEMSAATISTRMPDAGSPPIVQANSPQAAAIRARMLNTPAASECSKVSTASTSDRSRTKGAAGSPLFIYPLICEEFSVNRAEAIPNFVNGSLILPYLFISDFVFKYD